MVLIFSSKKVDNVSTQSFEVGFSDWQEEGLVNSFNIL